MKPMDKDIKQGMDIALRDYQRVCLESWGVENRKSVALEALEFYIRADHRAWCRAVRSIMRRSRPEWRLVKAKCYVMVDHSTRPMTARVSVSVDLNYYAQEARGNLRLYSDISERENTLKELERIVCGV